MHQPSQRLSFVARRVDGRPQDKGAAKMDRPIGGRPLSGGGSVNLLIQQADAFVDMALDLSELGFDDRRHAV